MKHWTFWRPEAPHIEAPKVTDSEPCPGTGLDLDLVKIAYTAAADRLSEQRDRLEGLRTRAAGLLSVAALIISFAAGIGLLDPSTSSSYGLPAWCLWPLFGAMLFTGTSAFCVLLPTRDGAWTHGPDVSTLLKSGQGDAAKALCEQTKQMIAASEPQKYNSNHLQFCRQWYCRGVGGLATLVLLLVAGVTYQHIQHPAPSQFEPKLVSDRA
ncbi:hypothetical protein ACFWIQ_33910 [Kitasatospora sp. NPDC127059]|uniref:hypothetical protein n=1 Tax=unclassified Kitasatospora TaxID=2633591 RepID=UPI00365C8725